jgi:hypothetical protein
LAHFKRWEAQPPAVLEVLDEEALALDQGDLLAEDLAVPVDLAVAALVVVLAAAV